LYRDGNGITDNSIEIKQVTFVRHIISMTRN